MYKFGEFEVKDKWIGLFLVMEWRILIFRVRCVYID